MDRKLTTIVSLDVVGYSRKMEFDEAGTLGRLKEIRSGVIDPAVERYSGRTVKLVGDGALLEFASVVGAVQCAVDIQKELADRNAAVSEERQLFLRIGIHLGDVIVEGDDIYGDGVNIASRLEALAAPGGIVLSKQVHDHIGANVPVRCVSMGSQNVKNIARPIEVFRAEMESDPAGSDRICFRDFQLDPCRFELRRDGEVVPVEPQVFDLLVFLARNHQRTVTKDEIFGEIWRDRIVSDAALSSQIKAARRAVGDDGAAQHTIATVHGRGFRFVAPISTGTDDARVSGKVETEAGSRKPCIAVLPFTNPNQDPGENVFADGITEDIITALSRNRWMAVVARSPAFAFRNSTEGIRSIGEKLNADYLVTGSLRRAGTRFRITVQVVDADTEQSVWSERFDRDQGDIFELQDEISQLVAGRLETELGLAEQKKAARRPRKNAGAWELYQVASGEFYRFSPESNARAQDLLIAVIEQDPEFASAHSRLAYAIVLSMIYFDAPLDASKMDEALSHALRAVELDDQDGNAYFTLGRVRLARKEYDLAIDALEHALELNPCLAVSYCGLGDSLAYEGRLDEAIQCFDVAIRLSPHDPFRWAFYSYRALAHLFRREFRDAATWARKSMQIPNAQYWARAHLVAALGHIGDPGEIGPAVSDLLRVKPEFTIDFAKDRLFYLRRPEQIELYLEGLRKASIAESKNQRVMSAAS